MREEIKKEAEILAKEATSVYIAINEHNLHLESLEKQTQKVEERSIRLTQKLLHTLKEARKDGKNTIIIALVALFVLLVIYLL
ncbi:hypothetical protein NEFER03_1371 [Nematocida sp. LUAm3]|nr:hypothetical protein NEFER03_1371 [Nematocida sp. LUAm3]KAI5174657.1 hypothetical protein NEFER02_0767 [Nematocida sp. LUAm2]KAI5177782.1 hypothetical protein NEFER01_0984 [Nematocida sp. LUAm1]